ncbi:hypothetical protein K2X05_07340 [bacterium]|nr:hypothetical protein [bacterium]
MLQIIIALFMSYAHAQKVGEITPEDQQRVRARVQALRLTSISFGPAFGSDMNNDNMFYSLHLGSHWEVTPHAEIRLNADAALASKNEGTWLSASVGGGWLIFTDDFSPVIGVEFGYGYAHIDGVSDPSGFIAGGFLGVRMFRTASAQMSIEYYMHSILNGVNPVMSGIRIGILF